MDPMPIDTTRIRCKWHNGRLYMSVVDAVAYLADTTEPRRYWSDLKRKLSQEGSEVYENIVQLKLRSPDGKLRETDCADTETMLRIVQSIPSPKAEPFKLWLAQVGTERLQDDAVERMRRDYEKLGYGITWIDARLKNVVARNALTDEWRERGAQEGREFALLTDAISRGTFDITTAEHKQVKHIAKSADLRDSMTPIELALTTLAEVTATTLHQKHESQGYDQLHHDAVEAGEVAGTAREAYEEKTGERAVSPVNYKELRKERQRELQPPLFGEE
jgi:DNA-damage-inducible protein D